jgi:hypothetical protein
MLRHDGIPVQPVRDRGADPAARLASTGRLYAVLKCEPDIDAAVLRTGPAAICGIREKSIMAARRRARMIVTVLSRRIRLAVVVVIVALHRGMIVALHRGMIVAMLLRRLVFVFVRPVLRANGQWNERGQRKRGHGENKRLTNLFTHRGLSTCTTGRWIIGPMHSSKHHYRNPLRIGVKKAVQRFGSDFSSASTTKGTPS